MTLPEALPQENPLRRHKRFSRNSPLHGGRQKQRFSFSSIDIERIKKELEQSLIYHLDCGFPCFLERFGILFTMEKPVQQVSSDDKYFTLQVETQQIVDFEKTDEVYEAHRVQFPNVLEMRDITNRVFERVRPHLSGSATEADVRWAIKQIIDSIKKAVVTSGWSDDFALIGTFVAHHNRQGKTEKDWFSGCDIFLDQPRTRLLRTERTSRIEAPVLDNAAEPFSMVYGAAVEQFEITIEKALTALGFETPERLTRMDPIKVWSFLDITTPNKNKRIFVTDGMQSIAHSKNQQTGSELVIQTMGDEFSTEAIARLIGATCLLADASKSGRIPHGAAFPLGEEALGLPKTKSYGTFDVLIAFPFKFFGQKQNTSSGSFFYSALTLISEDEAELITANKKYLLSLYLQRKGYQTIIKPNRPSVRNRTVVDGNFIR